MQSGTSQQGLWHWLRCQDIEILELSEIEARTFLQFRQRYLIHRKTARIERRFRHRRSRLQRHHIGLIHLERRYAELAFGIVDYRNHLIECNRDLHPLIHWVGLLKDRTGEDRPFAAPAPLLRKDPIFQVAPRGVVKRSGARNRPPMPLRGRKTNTTFRTA
jgi:hypothetical protein